MKLRVLCLICLLCTYNSYTQADNGSAVFNSFLDLVLAERNATKIAREFSIETRIESVRINERIYHRVLGPVLSRSEAQKIILRARLSGHPGAWFLLESSVQPLVTSVATAHSIVLEDEVSISKEAELLENKPNSKEGSFEAYERPLLSTTNVVESGTEKSRFSNFEFFGEVYYEKRFFLDDGFSGQAKTHYSYTFSPEIYWESEDGNNYFTYRSKIRRDSIDKERYLYDLQDLNWIRVGDSHEWRIGIRREFWGVTETSHRVDILNQTDQVESFDGEDKLGQPMINFSWSKDWGTLDLYALLGFRERTFAGELGRLRPPMAVNTDLVEYESAAERYRTDFAVRWSQSYQDLDLAISHFSGTSREPEFRLVEHEGQMTVVPYYGLIDQTGLELLYILGGLAVKFEGITRAGQGSRFSAATAGFEYTQVGIFNSRFDLGWLMEVNHDDRLPSSPIALGTRFTFNDLYDSQILSGVLWNEQSGETSVFVEASRRIRECCKLSLEAIYFNRGHAGYDGYQMLEFFDQEDFLRFEFVYYIGN